MKALTGWNVPATLEILGTLGDKRAIGPIRRLLETAAPVRTEARAALQKLGASWYAQRSDAERFGLWLGAIIACSPRSRTLTELIDFVRRGRFVPCGVQPQCVTDQQVMGLDPIDLLALLIT